MNNAHFKPVPIDEVLAHPKIEVDTYLKLGESKFIVIAKAGSTNAHEQISKYKSKSVQYLWVRQDDFATLIRQTISVAGMVVSQDVDASSKLTVVLQAADAVYKELSTLGFNDIVYSHARMVSEATMTLVHTNPQIASIIEKFTQIKGETGEHCMMVSMLSGMLGVLHGWTKPMTLEKLALGGLLHDVGKTKLPKEIADKPVWLLSKDERLIYQSHVELGRQMLSEVKGMPDDVLLVVMEHHELGDGSGFPRGLRDIQISPLARVVGLANEFVETITRGNAPMTEKAIRRVIEDFDSNKQHLFNRDALKALKKMIDKDLKQVAG